MATELTQSSDWLSPEQLATEIQMPLPTVYGWRSKGIGPRGYKIGRHVRYRRQDVEEWLTTRLHEPRVAG
jgi:excisionase family DNA binding protein